MSAQSAALEDDAGTLYPSTMNDTNGNFITLTYLAGVGSVAPNTSARIAAVDDSRAPNGGTGTYMFTYTRRGI